MAPSCGSHPAAWSLVAQAKLEELLTLAADLEAHAAMLRGLAAERLAGRPA